MSQNPKNRLLELLQGLGFHEKSLRFVSVLSPGDLFESRAEVSLSNGRLLTGSGQAHKKTDAEMAAASSVLESIRENHSDLLVDWELIMAKAQAGDALIKLGAYVSADFSNAAEKSLHLQRVESDTHLAGLFDRWQAAGVEECQMWGKHLSEKRKASLLEAIIWQRYQHKVLAPQAGRSFKELLAELV